MDARTIDLVSKIEAMFPHTTLTGHGTKLLLCHLEQAILERQIEALQEMRGRIELMAGGTARTPERKDIAEYYAMRRIIRP